MKILPNLCYCVYVYFNNKIRNLFSNSQRSFLEIPSSLPKIPRQFSSYLVDVILEKRFLIQLANHWLAQLGKKSKFCLTLHDLSKRLITVVVDPERDHKRYQMTQQY